MLGPCLITTLRLESLLFWLVASAHLKNMKVSWDDYSIYQ